MSVGAIEERDLAPLENFLKDIGGWPVLNRTTWDEDEFDLLQQLVKLWLYHNRLLINHGVAPDGKNSENYIIQVCMIYIGSGNVPSIFLFSVHLLGCFSHVSGRLIDVKIIDFFLSSFPRKIISSNRHQTWVLALVFCYWIIGV